MFHSAAPDPEKFLDFNSRINLFDNLRKLCLYSIRMCEFLKDLPLLKKLEVLMIPEYFNLHQKSQGPHRIEFKSSSLKKLLFKHLRRDQDGIIDLIEFNTPSLSSLVFWDDSIPKNLISVRSVKFGYPLKIQHLECIEFGSNMNELKNLKTLNCQKITYPFKLDEFESLQSVELFPKEDEELDYIKEIIRQKEHLKRKTPEIIVCVALRIS